MLIANQTKAFQISQGSKILGPMSTSNKLISMNTFRSSSKSQLYSTESNNGEDKNSNQVTPKTFREAEVLGLRLMQEGQIEEALKGMFYIYIYAKISVEKFNDA